jgi:hypothetical protein
VGFNDGGSANAGGRYTGHFYARSAIFPGGAYRYNRASGNVTSNTAKTGITSLAKFYPENAGFVGATKQVFLMPGQTIDRYGGSSYSRFFSPPGTPNFARSLPPGTASQPLRSFEVVKPFEVQSGKVGAWFHQPGGGEAYKSPVQLETLLKRGIIKEISP